MKNSDTANIEASAAVYRVDGNNRRFEFRSEDAALTYSGDGLLKKYFQSVHKDEAAPEMVQRFLDAYQTNIAEFKSSLRTVGVGTNIMLREGEGTNGRLQIPMVGRTSTGPDGTVALGKQSRAAGGAFGDIAVSGYRELAEEFICARDNRTGTLMVYNLVYDEPFTDPAAIEEQLQRKNRKVEKILHAYGLNANGVSFERLQGTVLRIPDLTQDITQILDGTSKKIRNRVLTDNPKAGDFAGVDTIVLAELPRGVSFDSVIIRDGEENFDGDLLRREWSLKTPQDWIERIKNDMPISPAPKKVFDNWPKVESAIRANL